MSLNCTECQSYVDDVKKIYCLTDYKVSLLCRFFSTKKKNPLLPLHWCLRHYYIATGICDYSVTFLHS